MFCPLCKISHLTPLFPSNSALLGLEAHSDSSQLNLILYSTSWVCSWSCWVRCRRCLCFPLASVQVREARIFHAFTNNVSFLFLLGALDNLMCFWWCENNRCIVSGWILGFACVRASEICYARLSELFLAQTGSSSLSENGSNSPPFSFECSLEWDGLAWARTRSALCFQSRLSESFSLERETMLPERELLSLSEIDSC